MFVLSTNNGWTVHAPAKINLALEVLGRQFSGYHEVETLLTKVRLFDTLTFYPSSSPLQLQILGAANYPLESVTAAGEDNLVLRALRALARQCGCEATGRVQLFKRIPVQAGLGGGSSDAAAALLAANEAWGLKRSRHQLAEVAAEVGTDVPFFLHHGAAIGTGRGEQIEPVQIPQGLPIVLAQPPVGLSTPEVFKQLRLAPGEQVSDCDARCRKLADRLQHGAPPKSWKRYLANSLQAPATELCSWVQSLCDRLSQLPVLAYQMTGSGSAFFAVCRTFREARCVATQLRGCSMRFAYATQTCM